MTRTSFKVHICVETWRGFGVEVDMQRMVVLMTIMILSMCTVCVENFDIVCMLGQAAEAMP